MKTEMLQGEGVSAPLILVADDEPVNLALIRRRLEWEQYRVETAEDGGQAVEAARRTLPDLIILDVMMPVMDGLQACRLLKADPATRDIPVIVFSILAAAARASDAGARAFLRKPIVESTFVAAVRLAISAPPSDVTEQQWSTR